MVEDDEAEVLFRSRHRRRGRCGDLRLETLKLLQHHVGAEDEIARVPEITLFNECSRARFIGLLHESLDPAYLRIERQRSARVNVTVAGGGMVGGNAEGDDFARIGRRVGLRAKLGELFSVLKHMVGGEHSDNRLRIVGRRPGGRCADGGGAVAPVRLEQDHRLGANLPQLLGDPKAIVEIGDDDRRIKHGGVADHADDQLKGRTLADQGNELLGQALPRFRPHAGARPAAHDHWQNLAHQFLTFACGAADQRALLPIGRNTLCLHNQS